MGQWQELQCIDLAHQNRVIQLYIQQNFPLEVRRILSDWIEGQEWESISSDEGQAREVYLELLRQVDERYSQLAQQNSLLEGPNFVQLRETVTDVFAAAPVNMALTISRCLSEERAIITSARTPQDPTVSRAAMEQQTELDNAIEGLTQQIALADNEIKNIDKQLENYDCVLKAWQDKVEELKGSPASPNLQRLKIGVGSQLEVLTQSRRTVYHRIQAAVVLAERVVSQLVEQELKGWRLRQHQACIGAPVDTSLRKLHTWFTSAVEAVTLQLRQLRKLQKLDQQAPPNDTLSSLRTQCEAAAKGLLTKLLQNALVIESQPGTSTNRPLIIKTSVYFTVKTRFLVNMSAFEWMPTVTLSIDKDFAEIGKVNGFRKFGFNKKVVSKLMDAEKTGLVAQFERLKLVEEKYKSNRQNESLLAVTEEQHFITCKMELQLLGLTFHIETSTLPLVVTSSTIQNPGAWAAVMWSAMAADHQTKNLLFLNPPPVTWQQLSEVLSWQFQATGGRGLDEQQRAKLRDRFVDNPDGLVSWNTFYRRDGHWVWIEGILDLIKKHLLGMWRDGLIMGFLSREQAAAVLQDKPSGTFLLRFSESIKEGAITFSWVDRSKGAVQVHAVEPYKKELQLESLADLLRKYQQPETSSRPLVYLYPDIPKDRALQQYYTPVKKIPGYVSRSPVHCNPTPPPSPEDQCPTMDDMDDMDVSLSPCTPEATQLFPELSGIVDWLDAPVTSPFHNEQLPRDLLEQYWCSSPTV